MYFNKTIISKLFSDEHFQNMFSSLGDRWYDEYLYEDIKDYSDVLSKFINNFYDTKEIKIYGRKRPFGFTIKGLYLFKTKIGVDMTIPANIVFTYAKTGKMSWKAVPK